MTSRAKALHEATVQAVGRDADTASASTSPARSRSSQGSVLPGQMGENVTTRGVDLLALRAGDPIAVQLPAGERRVLEPV